eukprot:m.46411 g.46411  ORF g.46411 m.46411 type:complete len:1783 (-) comp7266_c0_seq1:384-5732(-)
MWKLRKSPKIHPKATTNRSVVTVLEKRGSESQRLMNKLQKGAETSGKERNLWVNIALRLHGKGTQKVAQEISDFQSTKSLYLFKYASPIRRGCRKIVEHKLFEVIIITVILLNCISLAASDPTADPSNPSKFSTAQDIAEYVFLGIFTVEMILKVIVFGFLFCGPPSYLRNKWNILDFVIVVVGLLGIVIESTGSGVTDVKALRAFRVLRPLRLISSMPSLQIVLNSILLSIPALADVGLLLLFLIVIFAIIGLEFYGGNLNGQCFTPLPSASNFSLANLTVYNIMNNITYTPPSEAAVCSSSGDGYECNVPDLCLYGSSPNNNVTSFDNAGIAILTVFQCITLEGWSDILYAVDDGVGYAGLNWIFFVFLVIVGSFFVINLVLGVLSGQFTRAGEHLKVSVAHFETRKKVKENFDINSMQCWLKYSDFLDPEHIENAVLPEHMTLYDRERFLQFDPKLAMSEHEKNFLSALQKAEKRRALAENGVVNVLEEDDEDELEDDFDSEQLAQALDDLHAVESIEDQRALSVTVLGVRLPSGARDYVEVNGSDTFATVRHLVARKFAETEDAMLIEKYAFFHPISRKRLGDNRTIKESGLHLISLLEYKDTQTLTEHNSRALLKPNTVQMFSRLGAIVKSRAFSLSIIFLVLLNTILLASRTDFGSKLNSFFEIAETVFLCIFTMEIIMKIIGLGAKVYFSSKFNCFDFAVVIAGVLELIIVKYSGVRSVGLSSLRSLRLLRIFRELKTYWEVVNDFIYSLIQSTASILSLLLLMFIFMVIAALLGMQIFGGRVYGDGLARLHFDDFFSALLTIFVVVTGEDWNNTMYNGIASHGGIEKMGWIAVVFFCIVVVVGTFVLLNVFLAIAVKALDDAHALKSHRLAHRDKWKIHHVNDDLDEDEQEEIRQKRSYANPLIGQLETSKEEHINKNKSLIDPVTGEPLRKHLVRPISMNRSLFCLPPTSSFRRFFYNIASDRRFENFILILILISSALLAVEDPLNSDAKINKNLAVADIIFTAIFAFEMIAKIISAGFFNYVFDPWNDLDAVVVIASVVSLLVNSSNASSVRILRVFRVLRPLRAIKRAPGLRKVVSCMIKSIKTIGNVFIITFMLTFIYSVIGVSSFQGCFGSCNDGSVGSKAECFGNYSNVGDFGVTSSVSREWTVPYFNFNNVPKALITLFSVSTLEGWVGVMNSAIDCVGTDLQPQRNHNPAAALFFVSYIILVAFFMLNIFVGYVIVTFSEEGEAYDAVAGLNKNQRKCIVYCLGATPTPLFEPLYEIQKPLYKFVTSKFFEWLIMLVIIANTLTLMLASNKMSPEFEARLNLLNLIFTIVFSLEAVLKLFALNPSSYFEDNWNFFDFVIVVGSLADIALTAQNNAGVNVGFLRLFRVARLVKLVNRGDGMKRLLWTFYKSFQSLPYVTMLIIMLFFVYAVVGIQLFAHVGFRENGQLNEHNNFRSFSGALLLLFRCATGENWQIVMEDIVQGPDVCDKNLEEPGTCGSIIAVPFFSSFVLLCSFLILNLFVAVIIDNFEYLTQDASLLGEHNLPRFVELWSQYDPNSTHRITHSQLFDLLSKEEPPLGFGSSCPQRVAYDRMMRLSIPLSIDGTVDFRACLIAVVRSQLNIFMTGGLEESNLRFRELLKESYATPEKELDSILPKPSRNNTYVGLLYAVYLLQTIYREKKKLRELEEAKQEARLRKRMDVASPPIFEDEFVQNNLFQLDSDNDDDDVKPILKDEQQHPNLWNGGDDDDYEGEVDGSSSSSESDSTNSIDRDDIFHDADEYLTIKY